MKSNGEGERASEQRTVRGRGGATSRQVSSAFNSGESTITAGTAAPHTSSNQPFQGGANMARDTAAPLLLHKHFLRHQMFAAAR